MGWEVLLLLVTSLLLMVSCQSTDLKQESSPSYSRTYRNTRLETGETERTVEQLLSWIQDRYKKANRKVRQETLSRNYLPVTTTQQPRPFQPQGYPQPPPGRYNGQSGGSTTYQNNSPGQQTTYTSQGNGGYTNGGYSNPANGYPSSQSSGYPASQNYPTSQVYNQQSTPSPTYPGQNNFISSPGYPSSQTGYPQPQPPPRPSFNERPSSSPSRPSYNGQTTSRPSYNTDSPSRTYGTPPTSRPNYSTDSPSGSYQPGYNTEVPSRPSYGSDAPGSSTSGYRPGFNTDSYRPGYSTEGYRPSYGTDSPSGSTSSTDSPSAPSYGTDSPSRPGIVSELPGSKPSYSTEPPRQSTFPGFLPGTEKPGDLLPPEGGSSNNLDDDDEANHPPHIHDINVQCGKESMSITIEFNRVFDGIIYSKGFYNFPNCRYVMPNTGWTRYTFTVSLDSCGTQFIDEFALGKQAYLENVLVLQNEPGFQEVWDTVRSVRCLWEGTINKALSVALAVGSLQQEVVTFSGDTASARLDIQMGRGPYSSSANGLVKIGETMTLVVTVEGDPGFSVLVRDCWATDGVQDSPNRLQLTDDSGCVLKPKLMGAFQETRDAQTIRTYAFFQAFKFPDVMDLLIECNVELCKAQCSPCQDANAKYEPGVRRRRWLDNSTSPSSSIADPVKLSKKLHVYLPEELGLTSVDQTEAFTMPLQDSNNMCMSWNAFALSFSVLLSSLIATSFTTVYFILRSGRTKYYS